MLRKLGMTHVKSAYWNAHKANMPYRSPSCSSPGCLTATARSYDSRKRAIAPGRSPSPRLGTVIQQPSGKLLCGCASGRPQFVHAPSVGKMSHWAWGTPSDSPRASGPAHRYVHDTNGPRLTPRRHCRHWSCRSSPANQHVGSQCIDSQFRPWQYCDVGY